MAARDDPVKSIVPSAARPAPTPWWRRALGALGFFHDPAAGVSFSADATAALARIDAGAPVVDALADAVELSAFFAAVGADAADLHGDVEQRLFARVLRVARLSVFGAGKSVVAADDVLYAVVRADPAVAQALAKRGVTSARLTTFAAHRVLEHPLYTASSAPPAAELDVMLHNDDYTPQDVVTDVLERVFNLDHKAAVEKMLEVHHRGATVVATLPRTAALAAANRALTMMKERGFPLLVTLESFE